MATAREEPKQHSYEGGGGGKFRKRPFRRTPHTTPYDRPLTAFRNTNGGWLSKLVDPAQRLISSGAHRLFSTVFRKRLPPPQPPSSAANQEERDKREEAVATDSLEIRKGTVDLSDGPSNSIDGGELTELEQILKQKTFTRSEIDRLTAILHSSTVDLSIGDQEKMPEVVPLNPVAPADRLEGFPKTPARGYKMESEGFLKTPAPEHWTDSQLLSTPVVNSTVVEGDVASPTELVELAKSYMHKRPTSLSVLGFQSQALKENSTYAHNLSSLKLPITPLLQRASGHEPREDGLIAPRAKGRSAIYSMVRTPYSRVRPNTTLKGVENAVDAYSGLSTSSQYSLDQSLSSRSSQGVLKHRSSVTDNNVGSFGAIRRIRQKPNLLSSRGLSLAISGSPLSSSGAGLGFECAPATSKPLPFGGPVCNSNKPSTENADNSMLYTIVPSKSSEMASKILQQLDNLVSPKDKSSESKVLALRDKLPSELSPSMLCGQALKSLEDVDSSKFLGDVQDNKKVDGLLSKIIPEAQEFTSQKEDKVKENGPLKLVSADDKLTAKMNGIDSRKQKVNGEDSTLPKKDFVCSPETSVPDALNSVAYPPQKKRAFRMSAPEDFLDLDDDSCSNGDVSNALAEGGEKVNFSLAERKSTATEHYKLQSDEKKDMGNSAGSVTAEKSSSLIFQSTSPSITVLPPVTNTVSHLADGSSLLESNVYPLTFDNIGSKIFPTKDTRAASPIFNCGLKSSASPILIPFGISSDPNPETLSNLFAVTAGAIDSLPKLSEPNKAENKNNRNSGVAFGTSETVNKNNRNSGVSFRTSETVLPLAASTPTTRTFSFSKTPGDVSLKTGSSASASSTQVVFSSQNSCTSSIFTNSGSTAASLMPASTFASASSSSSLSTPSPASSGPAVSVIKFGSLPSTAVAPVSETTSALAGPVKFVTTALSAAAPVSETSSAPVAPVFKFGSSVPSTAFAPVSQISDVVPEAIKIKQDSSFGNFSSSAAATASTTSTLFGFTASAAASTSSNHSQASTYFAPGSASASSIQVLPTATVVATFSQSIPLQFGSSASSPTFALAGSTTLASGSSPFGSTIPAKPLSSETTNGLGSSSLAEANSVSSSSSGTPRVFSSSWQTAKSPVFSFNSMPSTGFSFGVVSSAPNAATGSLPSTGFSFGASSASTAANSLPSTGFSFGLSLTSSAAANSSLLPAFSFGTSSAPSMAANSSPALFGATTGSAATGAPTVFGSSNGASSTSLFSLNSSSGTTNSAHPAFTFGAPSSNNDQMNVEDSMAEDTVQASGPTASVFGQQPVSPSPSGFVFGSTASSVGNLFQFGSQPNIVNPQNPSLFQNSGSLGLGESNFSMGSGGSGVDKSNRKFVKVKHKQRKK